MSLIESARVVKLVDAGDSKSPAARRAGSIPAPGTTVYKPLIGSTPLRGDEHWLYPNMGVRAAITLLQLSKKRRPLTGSQTC